MSYIRHNMAGRKVDKGLRNSAEYYMGAIFCKYLSVIRAKHSSKMTTVY